MRCFIHTVTDTEFIRDWDGEDFPDREIAEQEAAQVARDLMAEQLREGRSLSVRWKVLLALADDTVLLSLSFSQLIPAPSLGSASCGKQLRFAASAPRRGCEPCRCMRVARSEAQTGPIDAGIFHATSTCFRSASRSCG